MEQVKRYAGRAAALALACFVVAFSVSVPAAAATVAVDINAAVNLNVEVRYTDNTYTQQNAGKVGTTPMNTAADDWHSVAPPVSSGKKVQFVRVQTDLTGYITGKVVQLHVIYRLETGLAKNSLSSVSVNSGTRNGQTWTSLPFTTVSSSYGQDPSSGSAYIDAVLQFVVPVESQVLRVYGTFYTTAFTVTSLGEIVGGVQTCEFMYLNTVTDQDPADRNEADRIEGSVNDKTQQSNQITNQIEQLQKPNVNSSSGKPVVGGMVVDPMQQVDRDSFNAYTNVLGTIFGSSTILGYFIIVFSLIFISYVIFGKSGG